jgi:nicotinate-nucleotide adenylyltransferase
MAPQPRRAALFGGTFDPIHLGHLAAARAALASGIVTEVLFLPAGDPPHKPRGPVASPHERWLMTVLATLDEPRFKVVRWELDREGPSYAVDTLHLAREALGTANEPPPEFFWVIGTDAMALIHTWHRYDELFTLTRFLVIAREGFDETALRAHLATTVPWAPAEALVFQPMSLVDVSSTEIRTRLAAQEPVSDLVPATVDTYIGRYGLYQQRQEVAR